MKKYAQKCNNSEFGALLRKWNREKNDRQMPWKGEKDPYKIWLSEIILQQTRVEQGLDYYNKFIKVFPDIKKLANTPDEKIFKLWEGLGYYSRCRNLIITAREISKKYKGIFPDNYKEVISLKGIGPYTASAVLSFAYNLPYAVVDGNVFRVLARVFGIEIPIDSTKGKKYFAEFADELLDKKQPGIYNQSIMDFGAVVCKPAAPLCSQCVFNKKCYAFLQNKVNELPKKEKRVTIKKRWFYYLVLSHKNEQAFQKRISKDIWQSLYEFPLIETGKKKDVNTIIQLAEKKKWLIRKEYEHQSVSLLFKQQLSHQYLYCTFIRIKLNRKPLVKTDWVWLEEKQILKKSFPVVINHFFADNRNG